eukprot:COSAG02_NODE_28590_length_586_cov_2.503080_1_plen_137_part_00
MINGTTYNDAVSVFDGLGGTPTPPTGTDAMRYKDWQLGGSVAYGTTTPSLTKITDARVTCKIPIGSYELDGFARAVTRVALADAPFRAAVEAHLVHMYARALAPSMPSVMGGIRPYAPHQVSLVMKVTLVESTDQL